MWSIATAAALCWGLAVLPGCRRSAPPPDEPAPGEIPIGYGTQPREDVTGAVGSVPASAENRNVNRVEELLRGHVPGLRVVRLPNGDISLSIRGMSSMLDDGEPLLVIDGMPVRSQNISRALRGLNPDEIDNIQVLKDVSSTSVYGTRGANGVILITLKR
ncbi:MAG: TonB-dependent receptor plug domain-containing protein [Longimicrobiales bacterium]